MLLTFPIIPIVLLRNCFYVNRRCKQRQHSVNFKSFCLLKTIKIESTSKCESNDFEVRMQESYKRFIKTWIRFVNPWIRIVS